MIIIYERLPDICKDTYIFTRLNFDTGFYRVSYLDYHCACKYIAHWIKAGYTFIHR